MMPILRSLVLVIVAGLGLMSGGCYAVAAVTGPLAADYEMVSVQVTDAATHQPIEHARVEALADAYAWGQTTYTAADGTTKVRAARYVCPGIVVSADGYAPQTATRSGDARPSNVSFELQRGGAVQPTPDTR